MPITPGTRLGPYEVRDQLGAGGMGEVYRAVDTRLERTVAIKVLPDHFAIDPERLERFRREAHAISSLNHPHICTLYDVGEAGRVHYLVMELAEGDTLENRLAKGRLPLAEALEQAIQIAAALDVAHRQGVVHRDLKPGNIMLTKSGVKLIDFGLAKLQPNPAEVSLDTEQPTATRPLTGEGTLLGTPQYMAPEQVEGKEVDSRTDIFALGSIIYEMVTGRRAFEGDSRASLIGSILKEDPPPMAELRRRTPSFFDHVVADCLAKDPDERWQSAGDVKRELEWMLEAGPVEVPSRGGLPAIIVALVVGAVLATIATRLLDSLPSAAVTRLSLEVHEGAHLGSQKSENSVTLGRPMFRAFTLSEDGQHLVYLARDGEGTKLYLRPLDQELATPIPGTERALSPFFSPDGRSVGFFVDNRLLRVTLDGGEARTLVTPSAGRFFPTGASWTMDDHILLSGWDGLLRVPANGGTLVQITTHKLGERYAHENGQMLPGGAAVLFNEGNIFQLPSEYDIVVQSLETERRVVVVEGGSDPRYVDTGHILFARTGVLMAVPFDVQRLEATGDPVVVVEDVMHSERAWNARFNNGVAQFSVSSSGTLAYLPGGIFPLAKKQMSWIDRDGNVEPLRLPSAAYSWPRFSPDGARLAYTKGPNGARSIWIHDIDLGTSVPLTSAGMISEFAWSPDGTRIAYAAGTDSSSPRNLYWMAADGSGEPERLTESDEIQHPSSWSADGVLAFLQRSVDKWDIMTLSMDGESQPTPFLETPFYDQDPAFSPDGSWLAYSSDRTGSFEVYVRPFPAGEPAFRVSGDGGRAPLWSPDGQQLFYGTSGDSGQKRIMVVDVNTADSKFARSQPKLLIEESFSATVPIRSYDISPDGQRFVVLSLPQNEPEPVTSVRVVLNWFEELKRRVPGP